MSQRYDYYISGEDWNESILGSIWYCQTFYASDNYTAKSARVKLWRSLYPGTGTIGIKATSGGVPYGNLLASASYNWNNVTDSSPGAWYEILLGAGCSLIKTILYALILNAPSGNWSNCLYWRADTSSGYPNGAGRQSNDGGVTWQPDYGHDEMFEIWGDPAFTPGFISIGGKVVVCRTSLSNLSGKIAITKPSWNDVAGKLVVARIASLDLGGWVIVGKKDFLNVAGLAAVRRVDFLDLAGFVNVMASELKGRSQHGIECLSENDLIVPRSKIDAVKSRHVSGHEEKSEADLIVPRVKISISSKDGKGISSRSGGLQ